MEKSVAIPEGVTVEKRGDLVVVTGPQGTLQRRLEDPRLTIAVKDGAVLVSCTSTRRNVASLVGTFAAHVRNMITGVTRGFEARLKVVYSHFPMKVGVEGTSFIVQNFLGERSSRKTTILPGVKVEVRKDDIVVSGTNKEDVGQTAGRIEAVAKVTRFDRRVFQDGIHLVAKTEARSS